MTYPSEGAVGRSSRSQRRDKTFKPTTNDVVQFPDGHLEDVVSVDVSSMLDMVTTTRHPDEPIPVYLHDQANGITRILRVYDEDYALTERPGEEEKPAMGVLTRDEALVCWRALDRVSDVALVERHPAYLSAHEKVERWSRGGTFACPICGKDTPHTHAPSPTNPSTFEELADNLISAARNEGGFGNKQRLADVAAAPGIVHLVAGRELDALVAEKVMGWQPIKVLAGTSLEVMLFVPPGFRPEYCNATTPPLYSTRFEAAWEVLGRFYAWTSILTGNTYRVSVAPNAREEFSAESHSFTEAVCRAALKAVGA